MFEFSCAYPSRRLFCAAAILAIALGMIAAGLPASTSCEGTFAEGVPQTAPQHCQSNRAGWGVPYNNDHTSTYPNCFGHPLDC